MDNFEVRQFLYFAIGAIFVVIATLAVAGSAWFFHYETKKRWAILKSVRHRERRL